MFPIILQYETFNSTENALIDSNETLFNISDAADLTRNDVGVLNVTELLVERSANAGLDNEYQGPARRTEEMALGIFLALLCLLAFVLAIYAFSKFVQINIERHFFEEENNNACMC